MICKKCGYDYPAKELKCPYCGEVNPLGEKWKNEENLARKETLLTKARVIHSMPLYVADKVMNVILLVITAVTALTFLVLAIVFGLEGSHYPPAQPGICAGGRRTVYGGGLCRSLRLSEIPSGIWTGGLKNIQSASGCMMIITPFERPVSDPAGAGLAGRAADQSERCKVCTLGGKEYPGKRDGGFLPQAGI